MTVTAKGSGTQTAVIGTEHTLLDVATVGTYTFHTDLFPMALGDMVELRIYQMVLTGGTRRVAYMVRYMDVQPTDDMIKLSVPISNELTDAGALRFTLKQISGVGRTFPWKVLSY